MPSHLTTFSIKQLLLQRLFTAFAVLMTSQSHLETEESLCPIPLATQLQDSKLCLDRRFSSGSNCSNLLAIDTGDQKGAGEEHSNGSFRHWKDGEKHPSHQGKLQAFQCCLSANEAEARISSSDLWWWHTFMAAD